jgi:hypothetical protein
LKSADRRSVAGLRRVQRSPHPALRRVGARRDLRHRTRTSGPRPRGRDHPSLAAPRGTAAAILLPIRGPCRAGPGTTPTHLIGLTSTSCCAGCRRRRVAEMARQSPARPPRYDAIDSSDLSGLVRPHTDLVNVTFGRQTRTWATLRRRSDSRRLDGLWGYHKVGHLRASLFNAVTWRTVTA